MTIEAALTLCPPGRLKITDPATGAIAEFDVEEARAALAQAENEPTEDARWEAVREFVVGLFPAPVDFARNQLVTFHSTVVAVSDALADERKKKIAACVSSLTTTPASPRSS